MWSKLSISLKLALTMIVILGVLAISDGVAVWRTHTAHGQVTNIVQKQTPFLVTTSNLEALFNHYDGVMNSYVLAVNMKNWSLAAKKWTKAQKIGTQLVADIHHLAALGTDPKGVTAFAKAWKNYDAYAMMTHQAGLNHRIAQAVYEQTVANSPATQAATQALNALSLSASQRVHTQSMDVEGNLAAMTDMVLTAWAITVLHA
ncbi:MAG: hypothetical protein C7B44_15370 [Sulfobacillus thermosulfidooxidans]|nr:MAG: hypothetical protein C7B44_15370 [Sulfobacillus thermosulfidooxidans]